MGGGVRPPLSGDIFGCFDSVVDLDICNNLACEQEKVGESAKFAKETCNKCIFRETGTPIGLDSSHRWRTHQRHEKNSQTISMAWNHYL